MEKSNSNSSSKQAKTPEELAAEKEAAAQKEAAAEKAKAEANQAERVKAAQTRTEVLEVDEKGKPTKTQTVRSKLLPDEKERHVYHAEIEIPNFDPKTGKKTSNSNVQTFTVNAFKQFNANAERLGYTVKVLWNPEKYQNQ